MKQQFALVAMAATLSLAACSHANNTSSETTPTAVAETAQEAPKVQNIKAADFKQRIESTPGTVLDVRTPGEVAQGVIGDATVINIADSDFKDRANKLDKSKPVYVYCKVGGRSSRAAKMLVDMGFSDVYNLQGGIDGWRKAGYETQAAR